MENLAVKELKRGREFANQLRGLIFKSGDEEDADKSKGLTTSSAEDLVAKVLDSFTNTLSLFNNNHHQVSADSYNSFFFHLPASSDESQESPKTKSPTTIKGRTRSSPKKRKSAQTWVEDSKTSAKEDGHAWRKYGQKIILNARHPRNYFRCTHKYDQGCDATKQVQQIQDDPPLFRTTYFGHHTCNNLLNPHIFLDSYDLKYSASARILSFDNNHNNNLITTFDQKVNNNNKNNDTADSFLAQPNHNLFVSSCSIFPSAAGSAIKNEENSKHCDNIKQEENINYNNNDKIINVVASCSSNDHCLVSPDDEEAGLPFGSGDDDQVDVFNSAAFYDHLDEFEGSSFESFFSFFGPTR